MDTGCITVCVYPPPAWRADARPSERPDDRSDRIGL